MSLSITFSSTALGCPPLKTPEDGYLVDHNVSHAQYMCCVGFVFPDTSRRDRSLHCESGHTWSTDLPNCVSKYNYSWPHVCHALHISSFVYTCTYTYP
jgi:hypothetical protein